MDINESNSDLTGKQYHVPENVYKFLQGKSGEGDQRISNIMADRNMSYDQIKRFKHDIENTYQGDWTPAIAWINSVLSNDRNMLDNQKRTTMETGLENRFRKTHDKHHGNNLTPLSGGTNSIKGTMFENIKVIKINEAQLERIGIRLINESTNFNDYKVHALKKMLEDKVDLLNKTKEEIKQINIILARKKSSGEIDENKK